MTLYPMASSVLLVALASLAFAMPNSPPPMRDQCTTTITSLDRGFQGSWQPYIEKTIYTTTSVVHVPVPCKGCQLTSTIVRAPNWGGHGPVEQVTATVTARGPFITTSTICALDGLGVKRDKDAAKRTPPVDPTKDSSCTVTSFQPATFTFGVSKTVWPTTVTTTKRVDCGGCKFIETGGNDFAQAQDLVKIGWLGTVTAKTAWTRTQFACRRTPLNIPTPPPVEREVQFEEREVEGRYAGAEAEQMAEIEKRGPVPSYTIYRPTTVKPGKPCTITALVSPTDDMGPTTTLYPIGTVKSVTGVECRGCQVESHTMVLNWFVAPTYEATEIYKGPSTRLAFTCTDS